MSDKYASLVKAGLHFNGSNGSTAMTDWTARAWTPNGNAQIVTAQSKFSGSSLLLDGNGDYLTTPTSSDLSIASNLWTMEAWVRLNSLAQINTILYKRTDTTDSGEYQFIITTAGALSFSGLGGASAVVGITGGVMTTGIWYHVAHSRDVAGLHRIFVNGSIVASAMESGAITTNAFALYLGRSNGFSNTRDFNGWMAELRITKGAARYVANFSPPQGPFQEVKRTGTIAKARQPIVNLSRAA